MAVWRVARRAGLNAGRVRGRRLRPADSRVVRPIRLPRGIVRHGEVALLAIRRMQTRGEPAGDPFEANGKMRTSVPGSGPPQPCGGSANVAGPPDALAGSMLLARCPTVDQLPCCLKACGDIACTNGHAESGCTGSHCKATRVIRARRRTFTPSPARGWPNSGSLL